MKFASMLSRGLETLIEPVPGGSCLVPAFSSLAPDVCFVFFASTCGRSVSTNIGEEEEEKKVEPFNPSFSTFVCQRERDERFVSDGAPTLDLSADSPNDKTTFM